MHVRSFEHLNYCLTCEMKIKCKYLNGKYDTFAMIFILWWERRVTDKDARRVMERMARKWKLDLFFFEKNYALGPLFLIEKPFRMVCINQWKEKNIKAKCRNRNNREHLLFIMLWMLYT